MASKPIGHFLTSKVTAFLGFGIKVCIGTGRYIDVVLPMIVYYQFNERWDYIRSFYQHRGVTAGSEYNLIGLHRLHAIDMSREVA